MNSNFGPFSPGDFAFAINVPSSFESLPDKLRVPPKIRFQEVEELRQKIIENAGMQPGTYSSLESEMFPQIKGVFDGLMDILMGELSDLNALDICVRLYERHEEFLEYMLKSKYESIPGYSNDGLVQQLSLSREQAWYNISPLTESIRWLIEIAVKFCKSSMGDRAGGKKLDQLIVLAYEIFHWDSLWENIAHGVIPHEITLEADSSATLALTPRAVRIREANTRASKPAMINDNRQWADDALGLSGEDITADRAGWMVDRVSALPEYKILSGPLEAERGYSIDDWLRFSYGLLDSFEAREYFKAIKADKLASFLSSKWGLPSDRFENLLADMGLSNRLVDDMSIDRLRPVEYARRDSRLLRRPVVVLNEHGARMCLYGVDTTSASVRMFLDRLVTGRLNLPDMIDDGPLMRAIGTIQTNLGDEFRDRLSERCTSNGFENVKEKERVGREKIPEGGGFGPVDVFVVDRQHRRFVLAEAKDVAVPGTVPVLMKNDRDDFLKFARKLNRQIGWFSDRLDGLKSEFQVSDGENYSVEGVIVVPQPRLWMYAHSEPLPILDIHNFIRKLKRGDRLETVPVP